MLETPDQFHSTESLRFLSFWAGGHDIIPHPLGFPNGIAKKQMGKEKQTLTSLEVLPFKEQMPEPLAPFTPLKFQGLQHYFWLLGAGLGLE